MIRIRSGVAALAGLVLVAGCESFPSSTSILGGLSGSGCPDYETGPAPFEPLFPENCRQMNFSASGLRWIELAEGQDAKGSPTADATVVVSYEGFLAETGKRIDSSYERGESGVFEMSDVTDGWNDALQRMSPGDEWMVYIPSELAYGDEARGDIIPANSDLVFRIRLDGFLSAAEIEAAASAGGKMAPAEPEPEPISAEPEMVEALGPDMDAWLQFFPWEADKPGINMLDSGVAYVFLEQGDQAQPTAGLTDQVIVHYEGRIAETSEFFDSSWSRGEMASITVEEAIPGFTEVLTYMRPGDRVLVHIPAELAYGDTGVEGLIEPAADLMFQINMMDIIGG
ncbi:MAG: hypothetical protein Hens3KO_22970 [Henriciella sp.]